MMNVEIKFDFNPTEDRMVEKEVEEMLVRTFGLHDRNQISYKWSLITSSWIVVLTNVKTLNGCYAIRSIKTVEQ